MRNIYIFLLASVISFSARAEYTAADFVGQYDCKRSADGWSDYITTPVSITLGEGENALDIHGLWKDFVVHATWDAASEYILIPNQLVDSDKGVWLKFAKMDMSSFTVKPGEGPFRAYPSDGDLVYEDMDGFGFFTADDKQLALWLDPVFYLTVSLAPEEWTVLPGKASYTDGWVAPALTVPVPSYEVTVWQNIADPNLYAVVNPYGPGTPFESYNLNATGEGFIIIDVSDPGCVIVKLRIFSGMTIDHKDFLTDMYNFNAESLYRTLVGLNNEEILEKLASEELLPSTFENGVITIHNCIFADQDDLYESYTFDADLNSVTVIKLPTTSLETVNESASDTPAEYYNLQGIRVSDPAPGAIYIRRQGDTAKKIRL